MNNFMNWSVSFLRILGLSFVNTLKMTKCHKYIYKNPSSEEMISVTSQMFNIMAWIRTLLASSGRGASPCPR